jgi:hypothetical protein
LRERPELPPGWGLVFEAFCFLHLSRASGFSLGAIPLAEIREYAEIFPVGMPRDEFVRVVRLVDAGWLKDQNHGSDPNASGKD